MCLFCSHLHISSSPSPLELASFCLQPVSAYPNVVVSLHNLSLPSQFLPSAHTPLRYRLSHSSWCDSLPSPPAFRDTPPCPPYTCSSQ
ncbi:hypothetical protein JB92DRAFT_1917104 [Gautieria morchelliformis]|nr:hypothetical protein JB92DRAFT_1917104 [Gautieria morchelliformis]